MEEGGRRRVSKEDVTMLGQRDVMGGLSWPLLALEMEEGGHEPKNAGDL